MAELYRQKVTELAHPGTRTEAAEAIRALIDAIVLTPGVPWQAIEPNTR